MYIKIFCREFYEFRQLSILLALILQVSNLRIVELQKATFTPLPTHGSVCLHF